MFLFELIWDKLVGMVSGMALGNFPRERQTWEEREKTGFLKIV